MIQEWPSISCYHQKQHLLKLEAYNAMSYNFSAKEARVYQKIKTLITSTRRCFFNTYPCIFGRILGPEEYWKLQRFVKIIEYFTTSSDYIRMCHWFWWHSGSILYPFISEGWMLSILERLNPMAHKGEDHMIPGNSFVFHFCNDSKEALDLLATRSYTCPVFLDLGAPGTLSGSGDSKFPTWN